MLSALPTGPCGSSTPSPQDDINVVALAIDTARTQRIDILGVAATVGALQSRRTAYITDSIGIHWRGFDMLRDSVESAPATQSP
jgi:hypothetical protein